MVNKRIFDFWQRRPELEARLPGGGSAMAGRRSTLIRFGLFLLLAAVWLVVMARPLRLLFIYSFPPRLFLKDFMQEWLIAKAVINHMNPYLPLADLAKIFFRPQPSAIGLGLPSPHPPPVVFIALPFGLLEYQQAALVWMVCEIACIVASSYIVLVWWQGRRPSPVSLVLMVLLLMVFAPFWEDLLYGQLSSLLLLLLLCVWRSSRQTLAGVFLGTALSLKLMGAPVLLFFLVRKKWRCAGVALGVFILFNLAAAMVMGFGHVIYYYRLVAGSIAWIHLLVEWNCSIWTLGWRLFAGVQGPFMQSSIILPLFRLPGIAPYVSMVLLAGIMAAGLLLAVRARDRDVSYALLFCLTAASGPIMWIHYLVLLFLPFAVALRYLKNSGFLKFPSALWVLLLIVLTVPDYALANMLAHFNINRHASGAVTVSFWAGLFTLVPLAVTLALIALVAWLARGRPRYNDSKGSGSVFDSCLQKHDR